MPVYVVALKDDATPEQIAAAKQKAKDQGGKIVHDFPIIHGFSVEFPNDSLQTLESYENIKTVELSGTVTTQT